MKKKDPKTEHDFFFSSDIFTNRCRDTKPPSLISLKKKSFIFSTYFVVTGTLLTNPLKESKKKNFFF